MMVRFAFPWVLAGLLSLAACTTTTPPSSFYTLDPDYAIKPDSRRDLTLALGPISMPQYLDRPQIVTREGGNRLKVDEFNRWGGSLEEEIAGVLAHRLNGRLGTHRIYDYPSRVGSNTDYRIALDIRRLDGPLGGELRLDVAWSIVDDRSGAIVGTDQSTYTALSKGGAYGDYAATISTLLGELGDDLANAVLQLVAEQSSNRR